MHAGRPSSKARLRKEPYEQQYRNRPWARVAVELVKNVLGLLAAALANYFILLPLFESFLPLEALIASFAEFIPFIHTKLDIVLLNAIPFHLLKGLGISLVTLPLYPKLTPVLRGVKR